MLESFPHHLPAAGAGPGSGELPGQASLLPAQCRSGWLAGWSLPLPSAVLGVGSLPSASLQTPPTASRCWLSRSILLLPSFLPFGPSPAWWLLVELLLRFPPTPFFTSWVATRKSVSLPPSLPHVCLEPSKKEKELAGCSEGGRCGQCPSAAPGSLLRTLPPPALTALHVQQLLQ